MLFDGAPNQAVCTRLSRENRLTALQRVHAEVTSTLRTLRRALRSFFIWRWNVSISATKEKILLQSLAAMHPSSHCFQKWAGEESLQCCMACQDLEIPHEFQFSALSWRKSQSLYLFGTFWLRTNTGIDSLWSSGKLKMLRSADISTTHHIDWIFLCFEPQILQQFVNRGHGSQIPLWWHQQGFTGST